MTRSSLSALVVAGLVLAACADDGPDADARRVVEPASSGEAITAPVTADGAGSNSSDGPVVSESEPAPGEPNGLSVRVQSLDNAFRPDVLEIAAGTEVVWTNDGRIDHDVIASDGTHWGVEADLFAPGDEYRHVFTVPGEYPYYCSIHGTAEFGMIGTVIVTD